MNEYYIRLYLTEKYPNSEILYIGRGWSSICFQVDNYIYKFSKQHFEDFIFEKMICDYIIDEVSFELQKIELSYHHFCSKYNKIKGELGSEFLLKHDDVKELSKDCALFLYQIHSFKKLNRMRNVPKLSGNVEDLSVFLRNIINNRSYEALIINNYKRVSTKIVGKSVLVHGDFYGSNFTVDAGGHLKGVFDWCNGGIGEREFDFVALYIHHGKKFTSKVICEYNVLSQICLNEKRIKDLVWLRLINRMIYASREDIYDLWIQIQQFYTDNQEEYGGMLYYEPLFI